MATIPGRGSFSGPGPSARSGREIATFDETPVGRGLERVGEGITRIGAGLRQREQQATDYDSELKFLRFKNDEAKAFEETMAGLSPDQAMGLADRYAAGYRERANAFVRGLPDAARGGFQDRLFAVESSLYEGALGFERAQARPALMGALGTNVVPRAASARSPRDLAGLVADGDAVIAAAPIPGADRSAIGAELRAQVVDRFLSARRPEDQVALLESPEFDWVPDREARIRRVDDALSQAFVSVERTLANGDYALVDEGVRLAAGGELSPAWYRSNEANLPPALRNGFSRLAASPGGDGQRDPMVAAALLERALASPADAQGTALLALSDGLIDSADFTRVARLAGANVSEAGRAAMDGLMGLRPQPLAPGADRDDFDRAAAGFGDWLADNPTAEDEAVAQRAAAAAAAISGGRQARTRRRLQVPAFTTTATAQTYAQPDQARALRATLTAALLGGVPDEIAGREAAKLRAWHDIVGISMPDTRDARDG